MRKDINWKFDISTYRLLGRELITDSITAIVELVKNAYDANAESITIKFYHTLEKSSLSKIIIDDDGFGMSLDDIESKWMTIGTNSKRSTIFSPPPYNRRVVGEKGVGRFAIDKLGRNCKIISKKEDMNKLVILNIDWSLYEKNETTDDFLKVGNKLSVKNTNIKYCGTRIKIKDMHDTWSLYDLDRLSKELAKIVSPFTNLNPKFEIYIQSNEFDKYKKPFKVKNEAIKFASEEFELKFDNKSQEVITCNKNTQLLEKKRVPFYSFGPIKFKLYHFDQYAKGNFNKTYKGSELQIDGIKIYRDGILTTPFAENVADRKDRRDLFGIDKRRWSGFFDKIASRDIIGIIEIYKDTSPLIIDATNRQDFLDTEEYKDLKKFVISQIIELENFLKIKKKEAYDKSSDELKNAKNKLDNFSSNLKNLKNNIQSKSKEEVNKEIKRLEDTARKANIALKQSIKTQKEEEKETLRKEKMYMSLMSLQTYAHEITHIIKTSIGSIKRLADYNNDFFGQKDYQDMIPKYNMQIVREINKLVQAIEFMSRYTKSEKNWEDFNVKETINYVLESYTHIFEKEKIKVKIEIDKEIILKYNNILFEDIIKNLINNSVKALNLVNGKIIKISGFIEEYKLIVYISDNGCGIEKKNKNKIYEVYFTTTAEEGGNGMGLYMVKTNLAAIKGSIDLVENEFGRGTTFKLTIPFYKGEK